MHGKKILEIAETAARRYQRRVWWASVEDMTQEAATAMTKATTTWDPKVGVTLEAYLWRVAVLAIQPLITRDSSPVSSGARPKKALRGLYRAPVDIHAPDKRPSTEERLREAQWRDEVWERVLAMDPSGGMAADVLLGDKRSAEVASDNGVDVREVYGAASKTRNRMRDSYDLYRLWKDGA